MSFKRDGNDYNLLNSQRRSRVNELFAETIPDEEAQILSNGKLSCTVCHYRPVFDTLSILQCHRQGRKHLENAERNKMKEKELKDLVLKHQQKQSLKTGATDGSLAPEKCTSKLQLRPYDRKPTIDLSSTPTDNINLPSFTSTHTSKHTFSSGVKSPYSHLAEQNKETKPLRPYVKKQRLPEKTVKSSSLKLSKVYGPVQTKVKDQKPNDHIQTKVLEDRKVEWDKFSSQVQKKRRLLPDTVERTGPQSATKISESIPSAEQQTISGSQEASKVVEKKELAEKYWQLSGSGWKKDWVGNWIKDENAEFDSDEEPPDLL
ncbi:sodium channel modifier 1 [Octopus bimaculoides]|uniref:Sodium channel modifier 1 n=1 Tax=Octopus bimaculoides TaxID=37653 RepID=A0A0L8G0R1_OCTBM|nr:sodium channel modifier 1 [Octopus bimaculoides]XP_014785285.1 sodium channel modifier 1 [Octopus bimaculoides]XP_014785286.1 sodium channel modifier 1 [Octopus bimaculoides]XP_014785287.1 sodium channel modifier 1 [Octopus bimaculoides]XP_014785288.1 sodium channel modifier 1 [Octopus bimaculoides]XP_014785289.1 sodium channel modifier 1 [Octopus bimaculoides]XP_052827453.1 sodium channel modifier 1 [Octopus bimaculoides]XP_052827454.1 sodium channel modifier 1 [Octopus bimaculoides]XP_|eukprot:XP_014785284.1 PREDICTED: sodium channel modifier 1-like [Octopus bimaculoides]